jgi:chromosome partitioning protein
MKGGVGKTTLAVNLAWFIHKTDKKNVLIVDLDPQFNATQYLMTFDKFESHRKASGTLANLFIDEPRLRLSATTKKKKTIDPNTVLVEIDHADNGTRFMLLPSELTLGWVVKNPAQMEYKLEKILERLRPNFDYIFIDCAPTESVLTTMTLTASDYVIVPIRPDRYAILGYANFLSNLNDFKTSCSDPHDIQPLGIVFTHITGGSTVESQCVSDITRIALRERNHVFTSRLHYSTTYMRAVQNQTPAFSTVYSRGTPAVDLNGIKTELIQCISIPKKSGI